MMSRVVAAVAPIENHSQRFLIRLPALYKIATVAYINANDKTVEGFDVLGRPCFTVQFHPEACPGPHDAEPLFDRFRELVDAHMRGES